MLLLLSRGSRRRRATTTERGIHRRSCFMMMMSNSRRSIRPSVCLCVCVSSKREREERESASNFYELERKFFRFFLVAKPMNTNTPFPRLLISCKEHTSIKTLKSMSMRILKSRLFVGVVSFFLGALLVFHGVKRKNTASCSRAPVSDLNTTLATFGHYIEHYNDERYLGKQDTFDPPARKPGYTYRSTTYQAVYDKTWTSGGYPAQSCWGCRFATDVIAKLKFHTILDAGTGNGALTRLMRQYGKNAYGIELSRAALEKECPDLLSKNYVEAGILTNLPYEDNSFDLVMSSDVLEHIDPAEADAVVKELVRVSRRHLFLSISLKNNGAPKGEAEHTLLRPRVWWHKLFQKHGAVVNEEFLWAMQEKDSQYITENQKNCRQEGDESDGGLFEVCSVSNTWLVGKREQRNVRMHRSVTTENGELEPWFFAFRKI